MAADNPPATTDEEEIAGLPVSVLIRHKTRTLTNAQRRAQKETRLMMIRRWWAIGFEVPRIRQLAAARFDCSDSVIGKLLRAVVEDLDAEAEAYEKVPDHHIRHRHRVRIEELYRQALDKGQLSVAERCLRLLTQLDGMLHRHDDDAPALVVSRAQQGARVMTDEQLAAVLVDESDEGMIIDVPVDADDEP